MCLTDFPNQGHIQHGNSPNFATVPGFHWISLVWMSVSQLLQEQSVGAVVEKENRWFLCVDSFSLFTWELNKPKRHGLVPKPVSCFSDHVDLTGSLGCYRITQQPITQPSQPCDLPLNYTITVSQRHLVTHIWMPQTHSNSILSDFIALNWTANCFASKRSVYM